MSKPSIKPGKNSFGVLHSHLIFYKDGPPISQQIAITPPNHSSHSLHSTQNNAEKSPNDAQLSIILISSRANKKIHKNTRMSYSARAQDYIYLQMHWNQVGYYHKKIIRVEMPQYFSMQKFNDFKQTINMESSSTSINHN